MEDLLLTQLFEESRYYRRFHHTIFIMAVTLYSGLLAVQSSSKELLLHCSAQGWIVAAIFVLIIPAYLFYLIFSYHKKIVIVNSLIYDSMKGRSSEISSTNLKDIATDSKYSPINFKKYGDVVNNTKFLYFTGKGHWFFCIFLILLVGANILMYCQIAGNALSDDSIAQFEKADAELEQVFQSLLKELKNTHQDDPMLKEWINQLILSQEIWKKFRDEDEQTAGYFWRGGGSGRAQTEWATRLSLQRIESLKKKYDPR